MLPRIKKPFHLLLGALLTTPFLLLAQSPTVPQKMQFANLTLTIHEDARQEIQTAVDQLTRNAQYFNLKAERAREHFPIIEKIFQQENLPTDFIYLVLQESALVPDAVSKSGAVGYWQFKDFTAEEMGMRVDNQIDERMNLVSSTRGAARYLKQNNFFFNNWICALQAYQMGAGGVRNALGEKYNGAHHMDIDGKTYWYVKKYLAHKIAFEKIAKEPPQQPLSLYETKGATSLQQLAQELSVDINQLENYNKWVKNSTIPNDKSYTVLIPALTTTPANNTPALANKTPTTLEQKNSLPPNNTNNKTPPEPNKTQIINGIPAIWPNSGETLAALALRSGIPLSSFLKYNDINKNHNPIQNSPYFIAPKKKSIAGSSYKTSPTETIWQASQRAGIQLKQLKKYNNLSDKGNTASTLQLYPSKPETLLKWLSRKNTPAVELDERKLFEWAEKDQKKTEKGKGW